MSLFSGPRHNTGVLLHTKTNSTNNESTNHEQVGRDFPLFSRMLSLCYNNPLLASYSKHLGSSFSSSLLMDKSNKSLCRESAKNSSNHL